MHRLLLLPVLLAGFAQAAEPIAIDVYRDPNCGCCEAWIDHLEDNGFAVTDHVVNDMTSVKMEHRVPHRLGSCHTGVIDGKFVEGHVPAADIL
ncbi:MAG: metal-binding protein, partial [Gammaproteobacteria bacterium HGW-Gammaproteobacteria-9]